MAFAADSEVYGYNGNCVAHSSPDLPAACEGPCLALRPQLAALHLRDADSTNLTYFGKAEADHHELRRCVFSQRVQVSSI